MVVSERPQFIPGYIGLADAHLLNNETRIAFDTLQNALKIMPDSRDVIRAVARIYAVQKDFKNAEAQQRRILDANPNDLEVRADMGDLFQAAGDFPRAEKEFGEIVRRAPKLPLGYIKLSGCFMAQKKWDRAIAESTDPPDPSESRHGERPGVSSGGSRPAEGPERALTLVRRPNPSMENPALFDTYKPLPPGRHETGRRVAGKGPGRHAAEPGRQLPSGHGASQVGNAEKAKEYLQMALASKADFPADETMITREKIERRLKKMNIKGGCWWVKDRDGHDDLRPRLRTVRRITPSDRGHPDTPSEGRGSDEISSFRRTGRSPSR